MLWKREGGFRSEQAGVECELPPEGAGSEACVETYSGSNQPPAYSKLTHSDLDDGS
jgi:hypothetical protein